LTGQTLVALHIVLPAVASVSSTPYQEEVISVEMDAPLASAYADLEPDIKEALQAHPGNQSVISPGMDAALPEPAVCIRPMPWPR
jgi:hypothetical protein